MEHLVAEGFTVEQFKVQFFYVATGAHGLHVIRGIADNAISCIQSRHDWL